MRRFAVARLFAGAAVALLAACATFSGKPTGKGRVTFDEIAADFDEQTEKVTASAWSRAKAACTLSLEPWERRRERARDEARRRYVAEADLAAELRALAGGYRPGHLYLEGFVKASNAEGSDPARWTFVLVDQGLAVHKPALVEAAAVEPEREAAIYWARPVRLVFGPLREGDVTPRFEVRCVPPDTEVPEITLRWSVDREGSRWLLAGPGANPAGGR